jgi:hypothetical protein
MRSLFTLILIVFIHLFSSHLVSGKGLDAKKTKHRDVSINAKKKHFVLSKKSKSSFQKTSFEDLPALQQVVNKTSFALFLIVKKQDIQVASCPLIANYYSSFSFSSYSYIFNFLYPKHVFW